MLFKVLFCCLIALRQSHDQYVDLACGDSLPKMLNHLKDHMRQGLETTVDVLAERLNS